VLLGALAELESVPGRRARAVELYGRLFARLPEQEGEPLVLPFLALLRAAREAGEISAARWWTEIEALESERPLDPAPVRELAQRALEAPEVAQASVATPTAGDSSRRMHALARLERFRARLPDRSLESLRAGEGRRWVLLLARFIPERALALAESELRRDPDDPALWRASAEALLAAGRWSAALERLEALQHVAPERETARLLALTSFRIENDAKEFLERLAAIESLDPEARGDPLLAFYRGVASSAPGSGVRAPERDEGLTRAQWLWQQREANDLDDPEHARALALALFEAERAAAALVVLGEAFSSVQSALEGDLFRALGSLMRSTREPKWAGRDAARRARGGEAPGALAEPRPVPADGEVLPD
jgi:tetratricopeptide (TPR) repeat protein